MAIALVACVASSCASSTGKFHVDRDEFFASTRTLLVMPMEGPKFDPAHLSYIDREVMEVLADHGFGTVDGSQPQEAELRANEIDAVLLKGLVARDALFDNFDAQWDGVEVDFELPTSGPYGLTDTYRGKVQGLSLYISIADSEGNMLFEGFGGIGLLRRWNANRIEEVDPATLLVDPDVVDRAVSVALSSLER